MRILIFGTSGFLGNYLFNKLNKEFKVFHTGKKERNINLNNFTDIKKKIIKIKPNLIINCAAITSIEKCQKHITESKKINVDFLNKIFFIKKKYHLNFNLIYFSTDQIYNPKKNIRNIEKNKFRPVNIYSKHKLMSEKICLKNKALVFRINLIGKSHNKNDKFTDWIFHNLTNNNKINGFIDSFYSPLSIETISNIILNFIKKKYYLLTGIYNLGTCDGISKFKLIKLFAEKLNIYQEKLINKCKINDYCKTKRTKYNRMNVGKFERKFKIKLPNINKEISNVVKSYAKN